MHVLGFIFTHAWSLQRENEDGGGRGVGEQAAETGRHGGTTGYDRVTLLGVSVHMHLGVSRSLVTGSLRSPWCREGGFLREMSRPASRGKAEVGSATVRLLPL